MSFAPLHLHTQYSLFESTIRIENKDQPVLAKHLKELQFSACAITDHNNLHGIVSFYNSLKKEGIKPIIGQGFLLQTEQRSITKLNLLCMNKEGYQNLIKLSSLSYLEGRKNQQPTIHKEWLAKYHEGLFLLSGELESDIAQNVLFDFSQAKKIALTYQQIFGNRFFLEISKTGFAMQSQVNQGIERLASECNISLVATNPCFYFEPSDSFAQLILQCMGKQKTIQQQSKAETTELYLKSAEQMLADFPESTVVNSIKIAQECELDLENKNFYLPQISKENGTIREKAQSGLNTRLKKLQIFHQWDNEEFFGKKTIYQERLDYELEVIIEMGFEGYFLIVSDFVVWAKQKGILVGPGRGSGAGSLVAYSLQITNIDPLKYDLLFERFLNRGRKSMPDIDIDFESENRDLVIEYLKEKYGTGRVAQISTLGSLQTKAVIKGVARVLEIAYSDADIICNMIPNKLGITLEEAMQENSDFADLLHSEQQKEKQLIEISLQLEGLQSNLSTHAAGIVIMDTDIINRIPLCKAKDSEEVQIQYTMGDAEKQGAVKFDILGLKNLTIIRDCLQEIQKYKPEFDLEKIPFDDSATYRLMSIGLTKGIFQMESEGMTRLIRKMRPNNFEDIIALIALYRPGPLGSGMVENYVNRKNLKQEIEYIHSSTKDILSPTYGVMVYQEQIIRIVQEVAGFSLTDADIFRRAMGKKDMQVMKEQQSVFIQKCVEKGLTAQEATDIFDNIDKFGGYGFNKSHSAAYAMISYQTAYLKCHYTREFYMCLLNNEINNQSQIKAILEELKKTTIKVLLPDINKSEAKFSLEEGGIRYGLLAIKGIGFENIDKLLKIRGEGFAGLTSFSKSLTSRTNSRVLKALICSGSLDNLHSHRKQIFENLNLLEEVSHYNETIRESEQLSFFSDQDTKEPSLDLKNTDSWRFAELLLKEKEVLGTYLSINPLRFYRQELHSCKFLLEMKQLFTTKLNIFWFAGYIETIFIRMSDTTSRKKAEILLEDKTGKEKFYLSEKKYEAWQNFLNQDEVVFCQLKKSTNLKFGGYYIQTIVPLSNIRQKYAREMRLLFTKEILLPEKNQQQKIWQAIQRLLVQHKGITSVKIVFSFKKKYRIQLAEKILITPQLVNALTRFLPIENIFFLYTAEITEELLEQEVN